MPRINRLLCSADDAVALIPDDCTIASGGFVGAAHPEAITAAMERRFLATGTPRGLTLVYAAGQGDGRTRGLNHIGYAGLLRRVIGGHWGLVPRIGRLAVEGKIEAYNFPQGVLCQLFRDVAAGRPGCITHIGLGTFIDPLLGGGRLNAITTEPLVERIELVGRTWLFYRGFPIHGALIRGTAADPHGNIVMDDEAVVGEVLPLAQAAHNSGGLVLVQVGRLLDSPVDPKAVRVPGVLVSRVVVAADGEHDQTFAEPFNRAYTVPAPSAPQGMRDLGQTIETGTKRLPLLRRRIAARACEELTSGMIANLGIGMPEGVAVVAAERGLLADVTLTVESGPFGGVPAGGLSFGASAYPEAIIDQPAMFDFYDGGGLDFAALGMAEVDAEGNVNVSRFGDRVAGVGGFVNISQTARTVVFCGTLTGDGLEVAAENGTLRVVSEGKVRKFVGEVSQVSFSGATATARGQRVLYVTERAVFRLTPAGVELTEVALGLDPEVDVIAQMGFRPIVREIRPMRVCP